MNYSICIIIYVYMYYNICLTLNFFLLGTTTGQASKYMLGATIESMFMICLCVRNILMICIPKSYRLHIWYRIITIKRACTNFAWKRRLPFPCADLDIA